MRIIQQCSRSTKDSAHLVLVCFGATVAAITSTQYAQISVTPDNFDDSVRVLGDAQFTTSGNTSPFIGPVGDVSEEATNHYYLVGPLIPGTFYEMDFQAVAAGPSGNLAPIGSKTASFCTSESFSRNNFTARVKRLRDNIFFSAEKIEEN